MNLRFIDWIWHVRGRLALAAGQSSDDTFDRLAPLFRQTGTSHERTEDTLVFRKKDPSAQDKMSIFDGGVLQIQKDVTGSFLRYQLTSRALLFCFLAPLLFLCFAQATVVMGKFQTPLTNAEKAEAAKKETAMKKREAARPMNLIDKALGAPAPEKPKTDKDKEAKDKKNDDDKKPSPTAGYTFAAIFATLYVIGRILEDWLIKSRFKNLLRP